VAEARLAWNDERGFASPVIPGFGLDGLFGARETTIRPEAEPKMVLGTNLAGVSAGQTVPGAAFEEHLELEDGGHALAAFPSGDVAMAAKDYGAGQAVLVGSFLGLAYQRTHDAATGALLLALAESAGAEREVEVSGAGTGEVEVRRLVGSGRQLVFAFNHAAAFADTEIRIHMTWAVKARDLAGGADVAVEAHGGECILHKRLNGDEIWVVELDRQ